MIEALQFDFMRHALAAGLDTTEFLNNNDGYSFFKALNELIITGPTRTNVNDFRAILIDKREKKES